MSKFNVIVIGLGRWGKNLCRNFSDANALAGVYDHNLELAQSFSAQYEVPVLEIEQACQDPSIHAFIIATPVQYHEQYLKLAIEYGKHAWVEKPLCISGDVSEDLLMSARGHEKTIFIDYLPVYHPAITELKQKLLGVEDIFNVESRRKAWGVWRPEGVMWDLLCHDLALMFYLFGDLNVENSQLISQRCLQYSKLPDAIVLEIENQHIHYRIENSCISPIKEQKVMVTSPKKAWVFDALAQGNNYLKELTLSHNPMSYSEQLHEIPNTEPLRVAVNHFIDCCHTGEKPITNIEFAFKVEQAIRQLSIKFIEKING